MRRIALVFVLIVLSAVSLAQFDTENPTTQPVTPINALGFVAVGVDGWYYRDAIYAQPQPVPSFVWEINGRAGQDDRVAELTAFVRRSRPAATIGRYTSATTTYIGDDGFALPAFCPIPPSGRLAAWYDRAGKRPYVDLRQAAVRNRLALWAVQQAIEAECNAISLDNLSFGMGVPPITSGAMTRAEWEAAEIETLRRITTTARGNGLRVVANVACSPAAHWPLFAAHVDGVLCELPMHTVHVCPRIDRVTAELEAYRSMLAAGKFVGMIPAERSGMDYRVPHAELCAAALMLVRDPGQACGVYEPSFRPLWREWYSWPDRLGDPLGPYRMDGAVLARDFAGGSLTVDFATARCVVSISTP